MSTLPVLLLCLLPAAPTGGTVKIRIVGKDGAGADVNLPARVHLTASSGKPVKAPARSAGGTEGERRAPFFHDHYDCEGTLTLELPPGTYRYSVERGPEYSPCRGAAIVSAGRETAVQVRLERWIDMARRGWWSGELHVHRSLGDMGVLLRAEDLHVAPVLTVWNQQNLWRTRPLPGKLVVEVEPTRVYHVLGCEDERGGGALMYFNLTSPLELTGDEREYPPQAAHLDEALRQKTAWVDVEKPFWWDVPTWVATRKIHSMGIANNHMCRGGMYEDEAWGRARDASRLPPPRGNGFYSQEVYYRLLNCGFRIPPSAGSASGVLPNPLGYNRVYVHLDGPFTYATWWKGLAAGRSFVTNGPMLLVEADGHLPGEVFRAGAGAPLAIELDVRLGGNDPLEALEVVQDGRVVRRVEAGDLPGKSLPAWVRPGPVLFERSGWFLVRAVARVPETFRFASTAPFYVEIGGKRSTIHRRDAQYFIDWIDERMARLKKSPDLGGARQRERVLEPHRAARRKFESLLEKAR